MIETDASDRVIAGVFSQLYPDSIWYPVAYFSKSIAPAEYNYKIYNKEMLSYSQISRTVAPRTSVNIQPDPNIY